ncbi:MATE family efflux transporter [Methylonatrum kenyense]|uniref:MATE family efflux transporter n=1 Tax=Methylonatrum kenyense TaxID=455253 RepID=UPI0020C01D87|nr:MATE family efflux transporter [Methylonatrum kenyense]MCK8516070.1 MATE family efflux transporter [Methylonatrum kenyense]
MSRTGSATTEELSRNNLAATLFRMTWPMLFGVVALLGVQLVDAAFIARLGVEPLAAFGFTQPIQQLLIGAQVGLGIATTALVGRALGAGRHQDARCISLLVVLLGAAFIAAVCILLWLSQALLLTAMGAEAELLPLIRAYWAPWLLSAWFGGLLYFGYSLCRARGESGLPGLLMVVTSLINLVLDPLFIFSFGWGLPGAAWATVAAFASGTVCVYWHVWLRHWLSRDFSSFPLTRALRDLGAITGPATLGQLAPGLAAALATGLVAYHGGAAVAAWGVGTRLEFFSMVVVLALTMSLPPIVSRFYGAGEITRIRQVVRLAVGFVLAWQLAVGLLLFLGSGFLSGFLSSDGAVSDILRDYLLRVPLSYAALGVCMLMVSVCNALGMPLQALLISLLRLFLFYLPALWLFSHLAGMTGLLTGAMLGNIAAGISAWLLYQHAMRWLAGRH